MTVFCKALGVFVLGALAALVACDQPPLDTLPGDEENDPVSQAVLIPGKGTPTTLDIAAWNIEWFGDASNGPSNETLQLQNVRDVISGADMDIWGVEEIVGTSQWNSLKSQLPGYAGLLANEASVVNGPTYYSDFNNAEQKVGILYKTSVATVTDARIILTQNDYDFAGRPPLQVTMNVALNGSTQSVVVIVMHGKCCSDQTSWQRRTNASNALKSYLDSNFSTKKVWVIGDFNDDVDISISTGNASPFANFVGDSARYTIQTKAWSDTGIASTVSFSDMIDHHLNSNEVASTYVAGSVEVYQVDSYITSYGATTSDHYPVLSRYSWSGSGGAGGGGGGGSGGAAQVIVNEIRANEPGSNTAGEFIELVNAGGTDANIGGWTISDASSVRHTFATGTVLAAGRAVVVFGGSSAIPSGLANALAASTGGLALGNGGDTVSLKNGTTVIQSFTYPATLAGQDGVSMNRSPDGNAAGSFVLHNTFASGQSSGGTRVTGAAW